MSQIVALLMAIITVPIAAVFGLLARFLDEWTKDWGKL